MRLVLGRDREVAIWAERILPKPLGSMSRIFGGPFVAIGVESNDGQLTGAFVINHFDNYDVNLTVAGRGAICRGALRAVHHYIFEQLRCSRITVTTRADNQLVIGIAERLGFVREGHLRKLYGDTDGILLGLLKKDFRL